MLDPGTAKCPNKHSHNHHTAIGAHSQERLNTTVHIFLEEPCKSSRGKRYMKGELLTIFSIAGQPYPLCNP